MTFDSAALRSEEEVHGLIDGGVDVMLLLETIFDTLNAKAAIVAIEKYSRRRVVRLPVMISVTITDRSGRTLSGQTLDAFYTSVRHAGRSASASTARSAPATCARTSRSCARIADCYVSCYPNAGLPNAFGGTTSSRPKRAQLLREFADQRLRQHHRRLLRHDAGPHRRDREGSGRADAESTAGARRATVGARQSGFRLPGRRFSSDAPSAERRDHFTTASPVWKR